MAIRTELLCCVACGGDLAEKSGDFVCQSCEAVYETDSGILKMLPPASADDEEARAKDSERVARDDQAADYDHMVGLKLFGMLEIPWTKKLSHLSKGDTLVEVGCGTGRMTVAFAPRVSRMVALDFSLESLRRCKDKLRNAGIENATLVQADATALPIRSGVADRVLSCQVLEHLPTPSAREQMVSELARVCKKDGHIVLSAYKHSLITKAIGRKEGEHTGGIYYYRFSKHELRELLERSLKVDSMSGALVYHYLVKCSVQ